MGRPVFRLIPVPVGFACALLGCGSNEATAPPDKPVAIAARTAMAMPAADVGLATVPATVVQPPGSRVAVTSPFSGMVRFVLVQPGQLVRKGQVLAVVTSRDALALSAQLAQSEARRSLAAAEATRMAQLAQAGVVSASRADAAALASAEADIAVRSARALLSQGGAGADGQIRLTAPIAGRIASISLDAGAVVDNQSPPIIIEAEGSRWLAMQLPERLAGQIRPGLPIRTDDGQTGRLETVGTSLDPVTRSFPARARLANGGPPLVSGRLLRVTITAPAPAGAVSVPAAAVWIENDRAGVFVKTADGFAPRAVQRLGAGDPAVIVAGLKPGEVTATSHLPELRAAAQP